MRIQNVDSRDNNEYYEIIIVCKDEHESDIIWDKLVDIFVIEYNNPDDFEISVYSDDVEYRTKKDFIDDIRKALK